jgi:hypothetical protein
VPSDSRKETTMSRRKMLCAALAAVPLAIGGFAYANATKAKPAPAEGFVCPVTGETLPCEKCCPLNATAKAEPTAAPAAEPKAEGYVCPLTGETLGCKGCCPLNQDK